MKILALLSALCLFGAAALADDLRVTGQVDSVTVTRDGVEHVMVLPPRPLPGTTQPTTRPTTQPAPDPLAPLPDAPTLTLGNGDTLVQSMLRTGARIWLKPGETVSTAPNVLKIPGDCTLYSDPRNPGTLAHPGGLAVTGIMLRAEGAGAVLDGLRFAAGPNARGIYVLTDNGTGTRLTRCVVVGEHLIRIVNASELGTAVAPVYADLRTEGVLGGAFNPSSVSVVGIMLNGRHEYRGTTYAATTGARIERVDITATEYAVRDMGAGSVYRDVTARRGLDNVYRSGSITLRPYDLSAEIDAERVTLHGGALEAGGDTGEAIYRSIRLRGVTMAGCDTIQLGGTTQGDGTIEVDGLTVTDWRGPTALIDCKRMPRGVLRDVTVTTTGKPTALFSGSHGLAVERATRNGVAW